MRNIIFIAVASLPMLASGQTAYTNCKTYGNRIDCEHRQQGQQPMGRILTVNPGTYLPQPAQLPTRNPVLEGARQAEEQMLLREQIE